jgi:hypothetical protein
VVEGVLILAGRRKEKRQQKLQGKRQRVNEQRDKLEGEEVAEY